MKNTITKTALFSIVAAILMAAPAVSRADDSTNAPAAAAPAPKKHSNRFQGKVTAVDAAAMTFTVGEKSATITSETKIMKDGQPAVFADITVGAHVMCTFKADDAGKMTAKMVVIGEKPKAKKPSASGDTNAPAQ